LSSWKIYHLGKRPFLKELIFLENFSVGGFIFLGICPLGRFIF
jgi:hypothetical protein